MAQTRNRSYPGTPFVLDSVVVMRADVYDSAGALNILNSFHTTTLSSVIEDEVFFDTGDTVTSNDLYELERNLRDLDVFSVLRFEIVPREDDEDRRVPRATLRVVTRDSWSLRTGGALSTSSAGITLLGTLREVNMLGFASQLGGSLEYTTVKDRGWRITGFAYEPNLAASHVNIGVAGALSRTENSGALTVSRPYYSDRVSSAFAAGSSFYNGDEYFFRPIADSVEITLCKTRTSDASGFYSIARGARGSRVFGSAALSFDHTTRDSILSFAPRAFENSIGTFVGIESIKREYERLEDADLSGDRLIPIGGMGSVSIGKISPHSGGLDNVFYIGADARQSGRLGSMHLSGAVEAGTGLAGKTARYTLQRLTGAGHLPLPFGALAARLQQSTIWNWPGYVALVIDNSSGLRGYDLERLVGDNRLIANIEYRLFPLTEVWIFDVGAAVFYDIGAVWSQGTAFTDARYHSSVGAGVRIGTAGGTFNSGLLRVDLAYNIDEGRISRIIISSQEAFDAFGTIEYRPPGPYVP